ncbi:hypothetical protein B5X24_HaOG200686 [Helicoverpa armigera]|uniref:Gustatory receptor n=1 Tax=Helicoverpa armigera TaxID=29058 RepID=A0A2W1BW13_HELAM|nr:hypothetical protein B5X24_HaOG200686 [Helicoverpa armigera]
MKVTVVHPFVLSPSNKLDKDILRIVKPFNIILTAVCSSKYKIRHGYITPCGLNYYILTYAGIGVFLVWSTYNMISINIDELNQRADLAAYLYCTMFLFYISYGQFIIYNIIHRQDHISLILKIQEIYRSVDISKCVQNVVLWNWLSFFLMFCCMIPNISLLYLSQNFVSYTHITNHISNIMFDFNFIYGIRIIALLVVFLKKWSESILDKEFNLEKKLKAYQNILEAFQLFAICFRAIVSSS